jgi:hypothetical protein
MALIPCPECNAHVSTRAAACPRCGCPREAFVTTPEKTTQFDSGSQPLIGSGAPTAVSGSDSGQPAGSETSNVPHSEHCQAPTASNDVNTIESKIRESANDGIRGVPYTGQPPPGAAGETLINPQTCGSLHKSALAGKVPARMIAMRGYWGEDQVGLGINSNLMLRYEHDILGSTLWVPAPGRSDWLAMFLPWLWHIAHRTTRGLWVFIGASCIAFVADLLLGSSLNRYDRTFSDYEPLEQTYFLIRYAIWIPVMFVYNICGSTWRVESLERRGYKCTAAVVARNKDEALARWAKQSGERG